MSRGIRVLQPTASKTALLLKCQRPFWDDGAGDEVEVEPEAPSPEAVYGIEFHRMMAEAVRMAGAREVMIPATLNGSPLPGLEENVVRSLSVLRAWLRPTGNIWGLALQPAIVEQPHKMQLAARGGVVTVVDYRYDEPSHTYDLTGLTLGLTPDLGLLARDGSTRVLDYKTGRYESDPAEDPQLLTLALAFGARGVTVMSSPPDAEPMMIQADVSLERLERHRRDLRRSLLRRGPAMNPGPWCDSEYCPRRGVCPAYAGTSMVAASTVVQGALARGQGPFDLLPTVNPGDFHSLLGDLEKLIAWGRAELKERVRAGEIIERRDGKVLTLGPRSKRNISVTDVEKKAPELYAALDEAGLVTVSSWEEMRAK